ncbi:hypothetical protein HYFRA_00004180 [Hymenoscyphus fraxineus]|uniref:Uncharacterized protein n=1 Tax=Hymenoscyphus fraxineus TaxID=746836 RepID=A0A9N9PNM7_9HELO|nr:hypothetical protein HYFRA_00004180 [Hymenoscyphus fraxineus]
MTMRYSVVEPHPTIAKYTYSGRGGAGNAIKAPTSTTSRLSSRPVSWFGPQSSNKFSSGRGGAGNIRNNSERTMFSFDEELERQGTREQMDNAWHIGRGGAGNWSSSIPRPFSRSSRRDSVSSNGSSRSSGLLRRLSRSFDRF